VRVTGLNNLSLQPDRKVVKALRLAGAEITEGDGYVTAAHSALKGFEFDATECPDLFPPLAALAMYCEGTTALRGARRLKHKESDRGTVIKKELGKLNGSIELDGDCMIIKGSRVTGGITNSHGDHRIAMACAIAALGAEAPVVIDNAESINKSYHEFYEHLAALGVNVQ
jgi:3-phosphoshikimate 1-carboxyvinyltransferase